jgi:predicted anti-sigma-YlaC factor YlaD
MDGYLENSLSNSERKAVEEHLHTCNSCNALFHNVAATYSVFDKIKTPELSPFFATRVEQALQSRLQNEQVSPTFAIRWMPLAASVLLLFAIGSGVFMGKKISSNLTAQQSFTSTEKVEAYTADDSNNYLTLESIFYTE